MHTLSIVHIGDIHYPQSLEVKAVDIKDGGLDSSFLASLAPKRLKNAVERVHKLVRSTDDMSAMLFSGDLTSYALMDGYKECVAYLHGAFGSLPIWVADSISVVPGNHDVDRKANTDVDQFARFSVPRSYWDAISLPVFTSGTVRRTAIERDKCKVAVFATNSCIGCGEERRLPEKIKIELSALLAKAAGTDPFDPGSFNLIGEQLDTPAFLSEDLENIADGARDAAGDTIPLVLAHHPLLPQAVMRVDLYTEVINGGLARARLTEQARPIVYLHGHIHDNPVEIIEKPGTGGRLISISAPLLTEGFNHIRFHFSRDRRPNRDGRIPLGCEVTQYNAAKHGSIIAQEPIRIPLATPADLTVTRDDNTEVVLKSLADTDSRFRDLMDRAKLSVPAIRDKTVASRLLELEWLGFVSIRDRDQDVEYWQIRKAAV